MIFTITDFVLSCGLFFGMLLCSEVGRRIGIARLARDAPGVAQGSGAAEAVVFGLLGLLLAFTFSGAASRFEARRHLITMEANAIGTAYLRVELLRADAQPEIKQLFRRYLDARVAIYQHVSDVNASKVNQTEATALQSAIWSKAVAESAQAEIPTAATTLLLPALNDMFDIATTRAAAMKNHPPRAIFFLLSVLSLISSLLAGYVMCETKARNWLYMLLMATTLSLTLFVILDLEYPRFGLIRIDAADETLIELRTLIR